MTIPQRSHLFSHATDARPFATGTVLFREGDPGAVMYVVSQGQVDLIVSGKVVETVGPEGMFGEMALLEGERRSTTAITRTDCEILVLDQKQFMLMVRQTPFFAIEVMRLIAGRLRKMDARLASETGQASLGASDRS